MHHLMLRNKADKTLCCLYESALSGLSSGPWGLNRVDGLPPLLVAPRSSGPFPSANELESPGVESKGWRPSVPPFYVVVVI